MKRRVVFVGYLVAGLVTTFSIVATSANVEPQRRPVPRPFPQPGDTEPGLSRTTDAGELGGGLAPAPTAAADPIDEMLAPPTEATLGLPIYPTAQFITSYEAGRGQRFYLFGTNSTFEEMMNYYRLILDERGNRVFDAPATHIFEVGRFREREMAFPPSVTIKDYTWDGSDGYLNPKGGEPARFKTVIQLVPPPPGQTRR